MFKAGHKIEITTKTRAYSHMGITDPSCIIPETVEVMTVRRVIPSKKTGGWIVWFKRPDNTGYGIGFTSAWSNPNFSFRSV